MRKLGREARVGVVLVVGALLALVRAAWGVGAMESVEQPRRDRGFDVPPTRTVEFVVSEFGAYWRGRSPFRIQEAVRLPPPVLEPPDLAALPPMAPLLAPSPPPAVLAQAGLLERLRARGTAMQLLEPAQLEQLLSLPMRTVEVPRPDRRDERERDLDEVHLVGGRILAGRILLTEPQIVIELEGGTTRRVDRSLVERVLRAWTREEEYRHRRAQLKGGDVTGHLELAQFCLEWGMLPEAAEQLRAVRRAQPAEVRHVLALGDVLEEMGAWAEAMEEYERAVGEVTVRGYEIRLRIGRLLAAMGFHEAAVAAFDEAVRIAPTFLPARVGAARSYVALGDAEGAMRALGPAAVQGGTPEVCVVAARAALMGAGGGTIREMLARVRNLAQAAAGAGELSPSLAAELVLILGVVSFYEGGDPAARMWAQAARELSDSADPWRNLGALYLVAGRWDEARRLFEAGLERDPAAADCAAGAGVALWMAGRREEAGGWLTRAGEMAPQAAYPAYTMAVFANDDRSWELFRLALAAQPEHTGMRLDAGRHALESGRLEEAEALLALAEVSGAPEGPELLGSLWMRLGRYEEAQRIYERLRAVGQAPPSVLYALGYAQVMQAQGDVAERLRAAVDYFFTPAAQAGHDKAQRAVQAIADWRATRVLVDEGFEGNQETLHRTGWVFAPRPGWLATLGGGKAVIEGEARDAEIAFWELRFAADRFYRLEATVETAGGSFAHAGVGLVLGRTSEESAWGLCAGYRPASGFARTASVVRFSDVRRSDVPFQAAGELPAPAGRFSVRLEYERQGRQPAFRVWVRLDEGEWQEMGTRMPAPPTLVAGEAAVVLYVRGRRAERTRVVFDDVRVFEREAP